MQFEELIERISPKLKAISRRLNARFAYFDEEDLYQEALIHLWEKFTQGELQDKTDSYILQGCFFFLRNYLRVAYKRVDRESISLHEVISLDNQAIQDKLVATGSGNQFSFIVMEILIDDILDCLDKREKEIFLLSLEELTTREIGRQLGISHVMVIKLEKKIREKLRWLPRT